LFDIPRQYFWYNPFDSHMTINILRVNSNFRIILFILWGFVQQINFPLFKN